MQKSETLQELPIRDTETQNEKMQLEKMAYTCLTQGCHKPLLPQTTILKKKKKMQYLWSTVKKSAIKRGLLYSIWTRSFYDYPGGGINSEVGINIYTLLYIKYIISKDLPYSTGNCTQYFVITSKGKESEKEYTYIYMYVLLNHCAVHLKLIYCKSTICQ